MSKDVLVAYKAPVVLRAVAETVPEPYRTILLVHPWIKLKRQDLAAARVADVTVEGDTIRIRGAVLGARDGAPILLSYLRGRLAEIESPWLFPLPSDAGRPANAGQAKKHIEAIIAAKLPGAAARRAPTDHAREPA